MSDGDGFTYEDYYRELERPEPITLVVPYAHCRAVGWAMWWLGRWGIDP